MRLAAVLALVLSFLISPPAQAVNPDEVLANPLLEKRARELSKELRCLVCQNQSIDDSDAQLAKDLRVVVREQLLTGASDQEILDFVVDRYGDFVLLRPPVKGATLILWGGPLVFVLLGIIAVIFFYKRNQARAQFVRTSAPVQLSDAERKRLQKLLKEGDG